MIMQIFSMQKIIQSGRSSGVLELSYSRVNTYLNCPYKYKLAYIKGWRASPTAPISFGLTIHKTLETYHKEEMKELNDLLDVYEQSWVNEGFSSPQQAIEYHERGLKILNDYYFSSQKNKGEIVFIEKEFQFPFGHHVVRGTIDRIDKNPDGIYEVVEYKTHVDKWKPSRVNSDLQMTLYAIACQRGLGLDPVRLSLYFLSHNEKIVTQREEHQKQEALCLLEKVAEKLTVGDYSPKHEHCPQCDFRRKCPQVRL